jgi:hypothetical protein
MPLNHCTTPPHRLVKENVQQYYLFIPPIDSKGKKNQIHCIFHLDLKAIGIKYQYLLPRLLNYKRNKSITLKIETIISSGLSKSLCILSGTL